MRSKHPDRTDRTAINRTPIRTKAQCRAFLESHFLYGGAYAVRVRIRDIRNKTELEEAALSRAVSEWKGHPSWDAFEFTRTEFWEATAGSFTYVLCGRSNGYAVLYASGANNLGRYGIGPEHSFSGSVMLEDPRTKARLVRKFDVAVEKMIRAFIKAAVQDYKESQKDEN